MEFSGAAALSEVSSSLAHIKTSHKEIIQRLIKETSSSEQVAKEVVTHQKFLHLPYEGKWIAVYHWCCRRNITPNKATVQQSADFFFFF